MGVGVRSGVEAMGSVAILLVAMRGASVPPRGCWLAIRLGARITACSCSFNYITMVRFRITKKGLIACGQGGRGGKWERSGWVGEG